MATTVFDQDITINHGGNGAVVRVWAEQEGSTVTWYAKSKTALYARTSAWDPQYGQNYYFALGTQAMYVKLRVGTLESNKVMAEPSCKYGDYFTYSGGYQYSISYDGAATDGIEVSAPYERYEVELIYTGANSGTVTVQEGGAVSAFVNADGQIVPAAAIYVNVDGAILQPVVWTNVDGAIVSLGG